MRQGLTMVGLVALVALCVPVTARAQDSGLTWLERLDEGLRLAQEQGKPVLIEFSSPG